MAILFTCLLNIHAAEAQRIDKISEMTVDVDSYENIHVEALDHHDLSSTFMIWVKEGVKEHYHKQHTETVYILEGEGRMKLNDEWQTVSAGDYIFIPKGTRHAVEVSSTHPMKVISIQSPRFDGKDRVFVSQK